MLQSHIFPIKSKNSTQTFLGNSSNHPIYIILCPYSKLLGIALIYIIII